MADTKIPNPNLNMRATYYIPQELDLRMDQMVVDIKHSHGVKISKSEMVRGAMEMLLSLGPARIQELLVG